MSFCYLPCFDITDSRNNFGSITFNRVSPSGSFTLIIGTDVAGDLNLDGSLFIKSFSHHQNPLYIYAGEDREGNTGLQRSSAITSFPALMQQMMRQAATNQAWPNPNTLTCAFNITSLGYSFGYPSDNFSSITWSTTEGRQLFGFTSNVTGPVSLASGFRPSYCIQPTLSAITTEGEDGWNFEPGGISMTGVSDHGSVYGITRRSAPIFREWTQQSEVKAKTFRLSSASTHPFTHQELFETCRSHQPFVVYDGGFDSNLVNTRAFVFKLRPDSCVWNSRAVKRAGGEMDDAVFDISYRAQVLGSGPT